MVLDHHLASQQQGSNHPFLCSCGPTSSASHRGGGQQILAAYMITTEGQNLNTQLLVLVEATLPECQVSIGRMMEEGLASDGWYLHGSKWVILHTLPVPLLRREGGAECAVSTSGASFPARLSRVSDGLRVLPYLHPFLTGAHVLALCVKRLFRVTAPIKKKSCFTACLTHLRVQAILAHGAVEVAQLLQDGGHPGRHPCHLCWRTAPEACGFQARNALQDSYSKACLALQREMEAFLAHAVGTLRRTLLSCVYSRSRTMFTRVSVIQL